MVNQLGSAELTVGLGTKPEQTDEPEPCFQGKTHRSHCIGQSTVSMFPKQVLRLSLGYQGRTLCHAEASDVYSYSRAGF